MRLRTLKNRALTRKVRPRILKTTTPTNTLRTPGQAPTSVLKYQVEGQSFLVVYSSAHPGHAEFPHILKTL